jgi:hypothetical protein
MKGTRPVKASAFVIVRRPDKAVLCTVEGAAGAQWVGVPGGKWEPSVDGASWERLLAREFAEEVGAPLPTPRQTGYFEWGSDWYQIRFKVMDIDQRAADAIPIGPVHDPGGSVRQTLWLAPRALRRRTLRAHVAVALNILATQRLVAKETKREPRSAGGKPVEPLALVSRGVPEPPAQRPGGGEPEPPAPHSEDGEPEPPASHSGEGEPDLPASPAPFVPPELPEPPPEDGGASTT